MQEVTNLKVCDFFFCIENVGFYLFLFHVEFTLNPFPFNFYAYLIFHFHLK